MKINKESETEMEIIFENDKATISRLLKEELDKDPNVIIAAWKENHPLVKDIYLYIKTDGKKKREKNQIDAIKRALHRLNDFEEEYNKIIDEIK
ncbi:RpoL/Rpb11 RNA polymerase subunit family protein [Candidatus Nanopusillus massiliensis]|uniref:RpoL/Rpb11 RNA polymerase subunit family protein n=1 Tax=Candidatus Nanopusillus massiliensis TaxID=2897163 RepID=UPI001E2A686E|nr:RpoL/Rpb11 RNA polymerase subunit family protein [Candidatus Nanopusillus massiliensis]